MHWAFGDIYSAREDKEILIHQIPLSDRYSLLHKMSLKDLCIPNCLGRHDKRRAKKLFNGQRAKQGSVFEQSFGHASPVRTMTSSVINLFSFQATIGALRDEVLDLNSKLTRVEQERDYLEKTLNRMQVRLAVRMFPEIALNVYSDFLSEGRDA